MSKEIAVVAGTSLAGSAAFVIHPHAAIGAAIGCCFFLAVPWGAGRLEWWQRLLLGVFSYGMGYAAGALAYSDGNPNGGMLVAGGVAALAAVICSSFNRTAWGNGPLPVWLSEILDRVPFLKRKGP